MLQCLFCVRIMYVQITTRAVKSMMITLVERKILLLQRKKTFRVFFYFKFK